MSRIPLPDTCLLSTGNPDDEGNVPLPVMTSPQRQRRRQSDDDKENTPDEKVKGDPSVDSYDDVTRVLDGRGVLSPCQRQLSRLDDTSQDCTLTSLTGNDDILSQRQNSCYGTQPPEGAGVYSLLPGDCYSDDESELTLHSPGGSRSCVTRGRHQPLAPGVRDDSVDVLIDSCFTLDCANTRKNNFTVSADRAITHGSSLHSQTRTTDYDVTGSDFTDLAFTFHSDGDRTRDSQFHSPTICRTTFADNLTRSRISGADDSILGGATCDSADFRFTFHTESSQIHFDSDMRREGGSDFRFSDCDSVSPTMTLRTVPLSFHT